MKRALLVAAVAALTIAGSAVSAQSAIAGPSATAAVTTPVPLHVAVSGSADAATVTWSAPTAPKGNAITGYTVQITPKELQPTGGIDKLGAKTRSDRFGYLTAGTTYTFSVRTVAQKGTSAAVKVHYTRPKSAPTHVESLYALTSAGALVKRPVAGGSWSTVVAHGAGYTVDSAGTAYVASDGTITAYPEGGTATTIASGLTVSGALQIDRVGDLFFSNGTSILKLAKGATTTTTIAPVPYVWAVAPDGSVTTAPSEDTYVTYPAGGGASVTRQTDLFSYAQRLTLDGSGNMAIEAISQGASGSKSVSVLPAGSSSAVGLLSGEPTGAMAASGDWVGFGITLWCASPAIGSGGCTPDRTVTTETKRTASGTVSTVAVTGLTEDGHPSSPDNTIAAADSSDDLFVAIATGPNAGLVEIPAGGGAVRQLDTALFSRIMVR